MSFDRYLDSENEARTNWRFTLFPARKISRIILTGVLFQYIVYTAISVKPSRPHGNRIQLEIKSKTRYSGNFNLSLPGNDYRGRA